MKNCINCNALTTNKVINKCGHIEYICEDCCKTLDNIHVVDGEYICNDNCTNCITLKDSIYETYNSMCDSNLEGLSEDEFIDVLIDTQKTVEGVQYDKEFAIQIAKEIYNFKI